MDLYVAQTQAKALMQKHGLTANGWTFHFDNSVKRFGVCKHRGRIISLSRHLTRLNDVKDVNDVILHEIAHALVGPRHGHDSVWKAKCVEIGAKPERCYNDEVIQPQMKYEATCEGCGRVYKRQRKPRSFAKQACHCQGHLPWSEKKLITWQETNLVGIK